MAAVVAVAVGRLHELAFSSEPGASLPAMLRHTESELDGPKACEASRGDYISLSLYIYIYIYIRMYVCVCIYI